MNILLVNDDGFDARGIRLLKDKLSKYGKVTIVAPKYQMSAKSCSITIRETVKIVKEEEDVYSITGFPADCTAVGLLALNQNFDLVVSGCNHGLNISYDTLYSGTIGACLEALKAGKKAIAFSCEMNFEIVDKYFDQVMDFIIKNDLISNKYFLNVNFPLGEEVEKIALSKLYFRKDRHFYEKVDENEYKLRRDSIEQVKDEETDSYMVNNHIVSVTPMTCSFFNESIYKELENKIK